MKRIENKKNLKANKTKMTILKQFHTNNLFYARDLGMNQLGDKR
jgi:hypothetical protein